MRGLTTAASIWGCSVIGILVGMSELPAAIGLAVLFLLCMGALPAIERPLPNVISFTLAPSSRG